MIHDENDKVVPYTDALEIAEQHPEIPIYTTIDLGHSLYNETVNEQIIYF